MCLYLQFSESGIYNKLWEMILEFQADGRPVLSTDYNSQVRMAQTGGKLLFT